MKVLRAVCNILSTLMIILLLGLACVFFVPKLMGGQSLAVLSGSMTPLIPVGSIVVTLPTEEEDIKTGDIVTYVLADDILITHRVIGINEDGFYITKGDANEVEDSAPVKYENISGKVVMWVPYAGYISIYIKTPLGIAGICAVVFVMIVLLYLPEIFAKEEDTVAEPLDKQEVVRQRMKERREKRNK